jgi:hypothetical protein
MRRLARILFNFATAISVLIFFAGAFVWVRGNFVSDSIYRSVWRYHGTIAKESAYWLFSSRGKVGIGQRLQQMKMTAKQVAEYRRLFEQPESSWKRNSPAELLLDDPSDTGFSHSLGFSRLDQSVKGAIDNGSFRCGLSVWSPWHCRPFEWPAGCCIDTQPAVVQNAATTSARRPINARNADIRRSNRLIHPSENACNHWLSSAGYFNSNGKRGQLCVASRSV